MARSARYVGIIGFCSELQDGFAVVPEHSSVSLCCPEVRCRTGEWILEGKTRPDKGER